MAQPILPPVKPPVPVRMAARAQQPEPAPQQAMVPAPLQNTGGAPMTEAVGFGRDLPLALALSQVVPPGYAVDFATDIDAAASVSWEGGKPWDAVLREMVAPLGLQAVVTGSQVSIRRG